MTNPPKKAPHQEAVPGERPNRPGRWKPGTRQPGLVVRHSGAAAEASVAGAVDGYAGRPSRVHEYVGAAWWAYASEYAYYSSPTQQLALF